MKVMQADKNSEWRQALVHEVYAAYLRLESDRLVASPDKAMAARLLASPNFTNPTENYERWLLINRLRQPLLAEIPADTVWYETEVTNDWLPKLHAIARCGWDDARDKNSIVDVAKRRPFTLRDGLNDTGHLLLWGHQKEGPFTILKGNQRMAAHAGAENKAAPLKIKAFVGLSPSYCLWHILDPAPMSLQHVAQHTEIAKILDFLRHRM